MVKTAHAIPVAVVDRDSFMSHGANSTVSQKSDCWSC